MNQDAGNISVYVEACVFEGNYPGAFGGGLYILFDRNAMQHYASVKNSTFMSNFGELGEEGLFISWLSTMVPPTHRGPNGCCV